MQVLPKVDPSPVTDGRFTSLDGLRGLAALAVVIHHVTLLLDPYLIVATGADGTRVGSLIWWWQTSPLFFLHAGGEAVGIFFILSGFVVPLPFLRRKNTASQWLKYYPSRLLRLYLPTLAAVGLALLWLWFFPHAQPQTQTNRWYLTASWQSVPPVDQWWNFGWTSYIPAGQADNPVWSLNWELLFSVLLPIYLLLATRKRLGWLLAGLCYLVLLIGYYNAGVSNPSNLALFGIGLLMAVHRHQIFAVMNRITARFGIWLVGGAGLVLALGLIWLGRMHYPVFGAISTLQVFYPLGAALLVLIAATLPLPRAILNHRLPQFLGRISFSLYLVHVPVLLASAYMFGETRQVVPATLLGVVISIVLAVLFQKFIEAPSHKFARWVGGKASSLVRDRSGNVVDERVVGPAKGR